MIKILFFADPIGSIVSDEGWEVDGEHCKIQLEEHVFGKKKFDFKMTINSLDPEEKQYDILIFDFGGIGVGASGMVASLGRQMRRLIENKPNTLFVAWTHFTTMFLRDECDKELGEYPNLICRETDTKKCMKAIKDWIVMDKRRSK